MMTRPSLSAFALPVLCALAAGCATAADVTIENRLVDLGLTEHRAACMSDDLGERLTDRELAVLARHLDGLSRADTPGQLIDAVAAVEEPGLAGAVLASGASCLLSRR